MNKIVSLVATAGLIAVASLSSVAPSSAAPLHHYGPGPGVGFAAGVLGFMAGAAAASAAANNDYYYGHRVYYGPGPGWRAHEAACYDTYRSYDAATDTYLGYDGQRHYCEL
ncbi:MAG TPA: BA14K family protein [Devosia sp.]|nr:BA14K family protein [Devosia sp.]